MSDLKHSIEHLRLGEQCCPGFTCRNVLDWNGESTMQCEWTEVGVGCQASQTLRGHVVLLDLLDFLERKDFFQI